MINKYHQIYVDIFGDDAEEVERFFAYSMTGEIRYANNFLFNLGRLAANGKSTITHMYRKVLPLYWTQISKDTFNSKNKSNNKDLYNYQNKRHVFCDEMDIYNIDVGQFKLICEARMTVKPLYNHTIIFANHSHTYITGNKEPRFKTDHGFERRKLLVETVNKFFTKDKYNQLENDEKADSKNKITDLNILDYLDNVEHKIAWIQLHLKYTIEMYTKNELKVDNLSNRFIAYCTERDNWIQLKIDRLELTNSNDARITKHDLAVLFRELYGITVSDDTARDEGKRIGLNYEKLQRFKNERGVFTKVRIRPHPNDQEKIDEMIRRQETNEQVK